MPPKRAPSNREIASDKKAKTNPDDWLPLPDELTKSRCFICRSLEKHKYLFQCKNPTCILFPKNVGLCGDCANAPCESGHFGIGG